MKRVLSSIGIGGATVDTVFPRTELQPGETVTTTVELYGGDADHEIEDVHFDLKTKLPRDDDAVHTIKSFALGEEIDLEADSERSIPVDIEIPRWTPLTRGSVSVWVETRLEIDWAKDPTDKDEIEVVPDEFGQALFSAVEELDFAFRYSELVETPYLDDRPFAQEFDFRPAGGQFAGELDELEITVMPREEDLRLFIEFDQIDEVAEEYGMDFDEQEISITLKRAEADTIRRKLKNRIEQYA